MRADAQRNYERIVDAAGEVFREHGYDASLEGIAKLAGVGPGTLYRHFPKRENLLAAVLQSWVAELDAAADKALAYEGSDRELLVNWFVTYVSLISQHKGGPAKLTSAMNDPDSALATKCRALLGANAKVIDRLREVDALRDRVDVIQVCRLVGGIASVADESELGDDAVRPMLEVVADGLLK